MGSEIERKFLVADAAVLNDYEGVRYRQGYLADGGPCTVRARVAGDKGFLTLKSPVKGLTRSEFEYEIPAGEADAILSTLCDGPLVEKMRYKIEHAGHLWEVDLFAGENAGLVMAEIELESEDEDFELPPWAGREVSEDKRYFNSYLAKHPYKEWGPGEPPAKG